MRWFRVRSAEDLGSALAQARKETKTTQAELADRLGVDRTTLVRMEAGTNPVLRRLVRAAALVGYDLILVPRTSAVTVDDAP